MAGSRIYMLCSISGGVLFSFMIATTATWSSPMIPKLSNKTTSPFGRATDIEEESWISSALSVGALLGVNIFGYLIDKFGRKPSLIVAGIPYLISHLIVAYSVSVEHYYVARFLMGLTMGSIFVLPLYLAEITHKTHRGTLMTLVSCVGCSSFLFSNVVGTYFSIKTFSLVQAGISVVYLVIFTLFGEETPHYYMINGKELRARVSLERLRGGYEDIDETLPQVHNNYVEEKKLNIRDIFTSKALRKAFVISTTLLLFQQVCGIVAILFYGQTFFQYGRFALSPEISVIILSLVKLSSSLLSPLLCAKFGRKYLLCCSSIGMFLSESVLAVYCYCSAFMVLPKCLDILPIFCLTIFIVSYNAGFGPLPWVLVGEIFPSRAKGLTTCFVGSIFQVCAFLMTKYFIYFLTYMDLYGYLAFSAGCCLLAAIFVKFYVIETKDKSLEDIERELSR